MLRIKKLNQSNVIVYKYDDFYEELNNLYKKIKIFLLKRPNFFLIIVF